MAMVENGMSTQNIEDPSANGPEEKLNEANNQGRQVLEEREETPRKGLALEHYADSIDPQMIQIKANSEDELRRRIEAFMQNKRNEINERNIREFISPFSSDAGFSCARVEAVYIHREGGRSHINKKRVDNVIGPQTRLRPDEMEVNQSDLPLMTQRAEAVEERLANMEAHLNMKNGHEDILSRIKVLETRISFLEGLSPEYFKGGVPQSEKQEPVSMPEIKIERQYQPKQELNLSDINLRIRQLKEVLKQKSAHREENMPG